MIHPTIVAPWLLVSLFFLARYRRTRLFASLALSAQSMLCAAYGLDEAWVSFLVCYASPALAVGVLGSILRAHWLSRSRKIAPRELSGIRKAEP